LENLENRALGNNFRMSRLFATTTTRLKNSFPENKFKCFESLSFYFILFYMILTLKNNFDVTIDYRKIKMYVLSFFPLYSGSFLQIKK